MSNYYAQSLHANKLFQVYDTSLERVKQYLQAEIDFVIQQLAGTETVLELGVGYGRIMEQLADHCHFIQGIDISPETVDWGNDYLQHHENAKLQVMDVHDLQLENQFDVILCLQNGLSVMQLGLESIRAIMSWCQPGGKALFSTYSDKFWLDRLAWFQEQADKSLLGVIDHYQTKEGVIVCQDGFRATTFTRSQLIDLAEQLGYCYQVIEVDDSSLFLILYQATETGF